MNQTMDQALDHDKVGKVHPPSQHPEDVKMVFNTRAEWEEELARRKAFRESDPWADPDYCPSPAEVGVPNGGTIGKPQKYESDVERLRRTARERQYEKEIETLHEEMEKLLQGVSAKDAATWPKVPYYIEGGIVQNKKWDDDLDEKKYNFDHVEAWRAFLKVIRKVKRDLRCGNCYTTTPKEPLKAMARCSLCKTMRYCSAACQKKDWRVRHKTYCAGVKVPEKKPCEVCRKADCVCGTTPSPPNPIYGMLPQELRTKESFRTSWTT